MNSRKLPRGVIVCGVGPIGARLAALATDHVVALVDLEPDVARKRLDNPRATVHRHLGEAVERFPGAAVVLCTRSGFREILDDLRVAARAGSSVVTSCEESVWPYARHPEASAEIDTLARDSGTVILGCGINPGFLMDWLPAVLAAPFGEAARIVVERRVDVATRREPLQRKVGVALKLEEFQRLKASEGIGHRGLEESMYLLGATLGLRWDRVESDVEPVVADRVYPWSTSHRARDIAKGEVIGMRNFGRAFLAGKCRLEMDLVMALGIEAVDRVELHGPPPLRMHFEIPGGVAGDEGTANVLLSVIPSLEGMPPGLRTVLDVPGGVRAQWGTWRREEIQK